MYLGIEIGGTKLQLGLGGGNGPIAAIWRGTVDAAAAADGICRQIEQAIPELLAQAKMQKSEIRGIGVGFGGPVDDASQTVIKSHQIQGWDDFPLTRWLEDWLGWPAVLGNDADVAGLAEALFGAGKGFSPIFYITIGSGIGGGFIINGEIYRGCGKGAAEIGHLRIPKHSPHDLSNPILEHLASGWAIEKAAKSEIQSKCEKETQELLRLCQGDVTKIKAQMVGEAAAKGDPLANSILHSAWEKLAEGICHVITLLCPRRIVIGGGVSLMGEKLLFGPLRKMVAQRVFQPFADCYDIVPAALGEEVVVHGALALARRKFYG
jgi:glucokinase